MVVYKVNIQIKESRAEEWFKWMSSRHIPDVVNTGLFMDFSFSKMIPNGTAPQEGYVKFQIEYFCYNMDNLKDYQEHFAKNLQDEHAKRYEGDFIAQREIYEDVTFEMKEAYNKEFSTKLS